MQLDVGAAAEVDGIDFAGAHPSAHGGDRWRLGAAYEELRILYKGGRRADARHVYQGDFIALRGLMFEGVHES